MLLYLVLGKLMAAENSLFALNNADEVLSG